MAKPLVAIMGETGSGKSELALRIAKKYNGEIICADAWTIRKYMDIGTAKPILEEREEVPHHLLDLIEPDEPFSAAEFQKRANVVINNIHKRNRLPILVGGSGLYIDSVLYNYSFLTTELSSRREQLNNLNLDELLDLINQEQIKVEGVDRANKRRLIRLIETKGHRPTKGALREDALLLGLKIEPTKLKERLARRLEEMIEAGLEDEVRMLAQKYGWDTEALKGVGYREWKEYFTGSINQAQLEERIIKDSLGLAKKQRTWFKRNKDIEWLSTPVNWDDIDDLMTTNRIIQV